MAEPKREGKLSGEENMEELVKKANDAFDNYIRYMQNKEFRNAGSSLEDLQESLEELSDKMK